MNGELGFTILVYDGPGEWLNLNGQSYWRQMGCFRETAREVSAHESCFTGRIRRLDGDFTPRLYDSPVFGMTLVCVTPSTEFLTLVQFLIVDQFLTLVHFLELSQYLRFTQCLLLVHFFVTCLLCNPGAASDSVLERFSSRCLDSTCLTQIDRRSQLRWRRNEFPNPATVQLPFGFPTRDTLPAQPPATESKCSGVPTL